MAVVRRGVCARFRLATAVAVASCLVAPGSADADIVAPEVEPWLDAWLEDELDGAPPPPMALSLLFDGRPTVEKGYGSADSRETVFRAASLTKLVTATAVLQLVERGHLRLDDPLRSPPGLEGRTLRDLLTHTSGLDDPLFGLSFPVVPEPPRLDAWLREHPPRFGRPAGRSLVYSNLGFGIAGLVVEQATGRRLEEYVEREIFAPLGMSSSSLRQPLPTALAARAAPSGAEGVYLVAIGAGALHTTAHDMARFLAAHLNDGAFEDGRILSPESASAMHAQVFAPHPALPGIALGFFESDLEGRRGLYHTGASGHQSVAYLLREERAALFLVVSPTSGVSPELRRRFVRAFLRRWFPAVRGAPSTERETSCAAAGGTFRPNLLPRSRIERVGELALDTAAEVGPRGLVLELPPLGSKRLELGPTESGVFRDADGYAAAFLCDDDGGAERWVLTGPLFEPVTFDRLGWAGRGLVQAVVGGTLGIVWGLMALSSIVRVLRRLRRGPRGNASPARWTWRLAAGVGWATLLAPIAAVLVYFPGDPEMRPFKVASAAAAASLLLLFGAAMAALLPLVGAWEWKRWDLRQRLLFLALALAAAAWVAWLAHWNLLGFRF